MAAAWARLGALSGAAAMAGAAYGAHGMRRSDRDEYQKELYDTANRYHLLHSLALLATPHCRRPHLAGSLLLAGLGLFCFPFYFHGLTGDPKFNQGAPLGGPCSSWAGQPWPSRGTPNHPQITWKKVEISWESSENCMEKT